MGNTPLPLPIPSIPSVATAFSCSRRAEPGERSGSSLPIRRRSRSPLTISAAWHICMCGKARRAQVFENTESTARQYALRERALALGWSQEHILVIDQDLGHSAASTTDRLGFQRLVASVGLGQVGLVLGLEVSRLARNSSDWHHLL